VKIENENQTLATISFQNYFRMYSKLSGMTGTADTEARSSRRSTTWTCASSRQPPDDPQGSGGRGLQDGAREVRGGGQGDRGAEQEGAAGAGGTVSIAKSEVVSNFLKKEGVPTTC